MKSFAFEGRRELFVSPCSTDRLMEAQKWVQSFPHDAEVLVLAPHSLAGDTLVHTVVAAGGSRFGIRRSTLNRLAAQQAAVNDHGTPAAEESCINRTMTNGIAVEAD